MNIPTRATIGPLKFTGYLSSTIKPNLALMQFPHKNFEQVSTERQRVSFQIRNTAGDFHKMITIAKVVKRYESALLIEFIDGCVWYEERGYNSKYIQIRGTLAEFFEAHQGNKLGAPFTVPYASY